GRSASTSRLRSEVERGRTLSLDAGVYVGTRLEQALDGHRTAGANGAMQRGYAVTAACIHVRTMFREQIDEPALTPGIPNSVRVRARIAGVMERSQSATVCRVHVGVVFQQEPGKLYAQGRGTEMESGVPDVEPVRDGR